MALINCPECGRAKVSDSAEVCPDCGYGIKAHFDKLREDSEMKKEEEERIKSVRKPPKPSFGEPLIFFVLSILAFVFGVALLCLQDVKQDELGVCLIFLALGDSVFLIPGFVTLSDYNKKMKEYNFALENFEEYQKIVAGQKKRYTSKSRINPECPYCHSTRTTRITSADKAVNIFMFGLLGQKRKYQWHCNNCQSNF